ncbi:Transcription factor voz1 [Trifolium repens]|jgi:hypothetical protein|nr:Transcription factor voz1 [Trifolium repens]
MKKISKGSCKTASHRLFRDKAKNHVDDLQVMFLDLQFARKESLSIDATLLEEQVHQMLREWRADLNEPSSAASSKQLSSEQSSLMSTCRLKCEFVMDTCNLDLSLMFMVYYRVEVMDHTYLSTKSLPSSFCFLVENLMPRLT